MNNAGITGLSVALSMEDEHYEEVWEKVFQVNVYAHQRLVRYFLPQLKSSGHGRVINIASTEGWGATLMGSAYVASKHAVIGLTKAMAVELGSQGVTCNCVCPGPIRTAMTEQIPEQAKEYYAKRLVPLRRYGLPEEVAQATLNFSLPASSFMNGAVVIVDGGLLASDFLRKIWRRFLLEPSGTSSRVLILFNFSSFPHIFRNRPTTLSSRGACHGTQNNFRGS